MEEERPEIEVQETTEESLGVSFWGVLAGAAVGVGAVAAAPFTGGGSVLGFAPLALSLAGAGGAAAAAGATGAVVGGVVVGAINDEEKRQAKDAGRREGEAKTKAERDRTIERMTAQLEEFVGKIKEREEFFHAVLAMTAVGMATANCDGEIHEEERKSIELFISGISAANLPKKVKTDIEEIYKNPPNLRTAIEAAREANIPMDLVDEIIEVVIHADGIVHREEQAFLTAWRKLRSAA